MPLGIKNQKTESAESVPNGSESQHYGDPVQRQEGKTIPPQLKNSLQTLSGLQESETSKLLGVQPEDKLVQKYLWHRTSKNQTIEISQKKHHQGLTKKKIPNIRVLKVSLHTPQDQGGASCP